MEPIHVLLVDDDPELTELLADYLQAENIQTSTASSADAALKLLQEQQAVDLMVLDIMMPGVSGLEFLQQIRPRWTLPVIMLTGRGGILTVFWGWKWGRMTIWPNPVIRVNYWPASVRCYAVLA